MNKLVVILLLIVDLCCPSVSAQEKSASFKKSKLSVNELNEDAPELKHEPNAKKSEYAVKAVKLLQANDRLGAIRMVTRGIEKDPTHVELYSFRAMLYSDAGNYKSALADCDKTISLAKDNHNLSIAYMSRGMVKRISKQHNDYEIDFKKSVEADPTNALAQFTYGEHLVKTGSGKKAIPHLEKAKVLFSKDKSDGMITEINELLKKAKKY